MDSLVERWRNAIKSSEKKSQHTHSSEKTNEPPPESVQNESSLKKSAKKKKRKDSQRLNSPIKTSKSQHVETGRSMQMKDSKTRIIEEFAKRIQAVKGNDQLLRLQLILEEFWLVVQSNTQPQPLISQGRDTPSKIQNKLYSDLETRYFSVEKQRQNLKLQLQQMGQRYESMGREVQRLLKIQKLVDNCIRREDLLNKQIEFLRNQLKVVQQKEMDQQRVFKKEVLAIYGLIEAIKESLPT